MSRSEQPQSQPQIARAGAGAGALSNTSTQHNNSQTEAGANAAAAPNGRSARGAGGNNNNGGGGARGGQRGSGRGGRGGRGRGGRGGGSGNAGGGGDAQVPNAPAPQRQLSADAAEFTPSANPPQQQQPSQRGGGRGGSRGGGRGGRGRGGKRGGGSAGSGGGQTAQAAAAAYRAAAEAAAANGGKAGAAVDNSDAGSEAGGDGDSVASTPRSNASSVAAYAPAGVDRRSGVTPGRGRGGGRGGRGGGRGGSFAPANAFIAAAVANANAAVADDSKSVASGDGPKVTELSQQPAGAGAGARAGSKPEHKSRREKGGSSADHSNTAHGRQKAALLAKLAESSHAQLQAGDLSRQLIADVYDCAVCTKLLRRREPVWTCTRCYVMLHQTCVTKWYHTKVAADADNKDRSADDKTTWSCPLCNLSHDEPPKPYQCFCGKAFDPPSTPFHVPHSCGAECGRSRAESCPHPCTLLCHPGACPPCTEMGAPRTCFCKATTYKLRCGEIEKIARSCGGVCGRPLACGNPKHTCAAQCHAGPCAPCDQTEVQSCFCGKSKNEARPCGSGQLSGSGDAKAAAAQQQKQFSCRRVCGRALSCGSHACTSVCHAGACAPCARAPVQPASAQKCACGQTDAKGSRTKCTDAYVTCGRVCGRKLACGFHSCTAKCHDSPCAPCGQEVPVECRCGKQTKKITCATYRLAYLPAHQRPQVPGAAVDSKSASMALDTKTGAVASATSAASSAGSAAGESAAAEPMKFRPGTAAAAAAAAEAAGEVACDLMCKKQLSCKRHKCQTRCCPANKFSGPHALHLCQRVCGKPLDCGKHNCDAFCHLGFCPPCGVVARDGITCRCGSSKIPGPVKCGVPPPVCKKPCSVARACGHACIYSCHSDSCPPCTKLVTKRCAGDHTDMKSIQCHAQNVSCGQSCKRLLPCGQHNCVRMCHAGTCVSRPAAAAAPADAKDSKHSAAGGGSVMSAMDALQKSHGVYGCGQLCGKPREKCKHKCQAFCHPTDAECPDRTCDTPITIYCACKRLSESVPCGMGGDNSKALPRRALECDDDCEVAQRNARFRAALQVDESIRGVSIPYPAQFLEQVLNGGGTGAANTPGDPQLRSFLDELEDVLDRFVNGGETSYHMKALRNERRWLVHQLVSYYSLASETFSDGKSGSQPRSMRILRDGNKKPVAPRMLLSEALQVYEDGAHLGKLKPRTIESRCVLEFLNLRLGPSDLKKYLTGYAGQYRLTWLREGAAVAVFSDTQLADAARAEIERKHPGLLTPLTASTAAAPSSAWSSAASATTTTGSTSIASATAFHKPTASVSAPLGDAKSSAAAWRSSSAAAAAAAAAATAAPAPATATTTAAPVPALRSGLDAWDDSTGGGSGGAVAGTPVKERWDDPDPAATKKAPTKLEEVKAAAEASAKAAAKNSFAALHHNDDDDHGNGDADD